MYIWWFPCQTILYIHHIYIYICISIWYWPTLLVILGLQVGEQCFSDPENRRPGDVQQSIRTLQLASKQIHNELLAIVKVCGVCSTHVNVCVCVWCVCVCVCVCGACVCVCAWRTSHIRSYSSARSATSSRVGSMTSCLPSCRGRQNVFKLTCALGIIQVYGYPCACYK